MSFKSVLIRIASGTIGGFTLGALSGAFVDVGTPNSLSFGLFCASSGFIAGAVGHIMFAGPGRTTTVRSIFNFAIIGCVFFLSLSLFTPEALADLMNVSDPLKSLIIGLIGGATGGAIIVILLGDYAAN